MNGDRYFECSLVSLVSCKEYLTYLTGINFKHQSTLTAYTNLTFSYIDRLSTSSRKGVINCNNGPVFWLTLYIILVLTVTLLNTLNYRFNYVYINRVVGFGGERKRLSN